MSVVIWARKIVCTDTGTLNFCTTTIIGECTDKSGTYYTELKLLEPSSQRIKVYEYPLPYGDFPADVIFMVVRRYNAIQYQKMNRADFGYYWKIFF